MARGGWFRMYDELLDDPKVQQLPAEDFRGWVNLLCLARRNDGYLPDIEAIAFALRIDVIGARSLVDRLTIATLIDTHKGGANGSRIAPHGWSERQYKSDTSTERVKRFRQRSETVSETPPETEAETETERMKSNRAKGAAPLAFEGKIIRVTQGQLDQWQRAFPAIDIPASLQSRDDWLFHEADEAIRKKWFLSTSNHLANLQQKATAAKRSAANDRDRITV